MASNRSYRTVKILLVLADIFGDVEKETAITMEATMQDLHIKESIVSVEQTDLQSLRTNTNSKIQCACGKEVNSHASLKRHQRSCRVIMGLNDELNYALQENNEEIFGDQSESTVKVNLAEDTIIKPGIKLPKSESEWKTANSFFHANLPIADMNTDGDFK